MSQLASPRIPAAARAAALALVVTLAAGGCSGESSNDQSPPVFPASADASAADGAGGATSATAADPRETPAPGRYLTDLTTAGAGACAGTTLGALLDAIRAATPDLAAVTTVYDPTQQGVGDGSFIYPYLRADGGFDIVFKLGSGDCPSGCTDNDYRYFATDPSCTPALVGHFHTSWGTGTCLATDGTPMWDHPPPPDPLTVCGADNAPQDLRGSYTLQAVGQQQACVTATDASAPVSVDEPVMMTIDQDPSNLAAATVTFQGTGNSLVDGVPLPAQVQRRRFDAVLQSGNLPNACPQTQSVTAQYDFENYQPGGIDVVESGSDSCTDCKGFMSVTLSAM